MYCDAYKCSWPWHCTWFPSFKQINKSWYSFLAKAQIAQINSLFNRAFKYGYVKFIITVEEL